MDDLSLEKHIIKVRHLLTRSVTDMDDFSTYEKIRKNYLNFVIECHRAYKTAQDILINDYLEIENNLSPLHKKKQEGVREKESVCKQLFRLKCQKRIVELCYESLVWIIMKMDKVNFKSLFKGPKYGLIINQNVRSVLGYVEEENKSPYVFVIPLDFCRFSPICDAIRISYDEKYYVWKHEYLELKEGIVNAEIENTIKKGTDEDYISFFEHHGEKGIQQMERYLKQIQFGCASIKLIDKPTGVYKDPTHPEKDRVILSSPIEERTFIDQIVEIYDKNVNNEFAIAEVDNCIVVGFVNCLDRRYQQLGEFDIRHYVLHRYSSKCKICNQTDDDVVRILNSVKLNDWRSGFSSVVLYPILLRPLISNQSVIDMLFGKRKLLYFLNLDEFVSLALSDGITVDYVNAKAFRKDMKENPSNELVKNNNKFLKIGLKKGPLYLCEGTVHEMVYNWINPISIINRLKNLEYPTQILMHGYV